MAIVKFISEKDCKLFIDMEFVGIIQANSMLKITLVSGSYLVEMKNLSDVLIKKYELRICVDDMQVLQNLSQVTNSLKESIDKLKDEPTLHFYNQRALLKHDGMYGFINSRYELVITPMYSYAEDFICERTLVKKQFPENEMATIIDTDGNICYERWFEYIGSSNDTVLLKDEDKYIVFLRDDFSILCEYFDAGYNGKGELIPVYKKEGVDDNYGFIDKSGCEKVPFIYDFVCNFEESGYSFVKSRGIFYAVDRFGNLYGRIPSNEEEKKELLWSSKENSVIEHVADEEEYFHAYKSDKFLFGGFNWETAYYAYRVGEFCTLIFGVWEGRVIRDLDKNTEQLVYEDKEKYVFKADSIEPITEFFEGYGHDDYDVRLVLIKRNRKYGISKVSGEIILPVEYDHLIPIIYCVEENWIRDYNEKRIEGFIGKKGNEYIYINDKGEYMYPVEYSKAYNMLESIDKPIEYLSQFLTISCVKKNGNKPQEKSLQDLE